MRTNLVFTLTGTDRVGIVEEVTRIMLDLGANVETSRMVRLGGEFAILMLVSLPGEPASQIEDAFASLVGQGYRISTTLTAPGDAAGDRVIYRVTVRGADHEGIVHEIARGLSARGINIESMETGTSEAPVSGTPLFSMDAVVAVPTDVAEPDWMAALAAAGELAGVDVEIALAETR